MRKVISLQDARARKAQGSSQMDQQLLIKLSEKVIDLQRDVDQMTHLIHRFERLVKMLTIIVEPVEDDDE